jgi:predicted transcriptional regulator
MKRMLVEIDDRSARDLERVAPARERKRAEFIRLAIRRAIDAALDRATRDAYRREPVSGDVVANDLEGWDDRNGLAVHARPQVKARKRAGSRRRVA